MTITEALSFYGYHKEYMGSDRAEIVIKALEFYRDHKDHKCKATDDEEFVARLQDWVKGCFMSGADNDFDAGRLAAFSMVRDYLETRHETSTAWSDEISCPWCKKLQNHLQIEIEPVFYTCSGCGKLFEVEVETKYRTHKIGRIE